MSRISELNTDHGMMGSPPSPGDAASVGCGRPTLGLARIYLLRIAVARPGATGQRRRRHP